MGKKIILFGAKSFEKRLKYYIEKYTKDKVYAFCVDKKYLEQNEFCGIPVISTEELRKIYPPEDYYVLIGIGYKNMNNLRRQKFAEVSREGYRFYNFIHPSANLDESVSIGEGNIIMSNVLLDYETYLGDCNIIESGTIISHECSINNFNYFAPGVVVGGKVCVEDNCFLGLNATIRSAISLKSYSLIGAACYIDEDTYKYGVYVPNRKILLKKKSIDMELMYKGGK